MAAKKPSKPSRTLDNKVNPATTVATATAPAPVSPAVAAAIAKPVTAAPATPVVSATVAAIATAAVAARTEPVRDRSSIIALISKLRDNDAEIARDAAVTLGTLPADGEAIDALCDVVRNTDRFFHPVVRAAAAATLGKLGDRRAVDALIVATGDTMAEASEEAVKALGRLGDARAVSTLQTIIRNEQGFFLDPVRRTAEAAVARLKTKN